MPSWDLRDESVYERDRAERLLHRLGKERGVTRREVLRMLAVGGGVVVLGGGASARAWADHVSVVKPTPPDLFIVHGSNREMRWEAMFGRGYRTPNDLFFVRNHGRTPHIDVSTWRLTIGGTGIRRPVELTYDDLLAMPATTETKFIECAGNGRSFFETVQGRRASGTQWRLGAVGVAEWTGVSLADVLDRAHVERTALDVMPVGLDAPGVRRPLSIEKALDDVMIVYAMNGEPLPPDHGYPVRMLVPGWVGIANIKWVGHIEVSAEPLFSPWNTTTYRLFGPDYPDAPVLTDQTVKSAFELPWDGEIRAGPRLLTGRSWSGVGRIESVEVRVDNGPWMPAALGDRNGPGAWVQWEVSWTAEPGAHRLRVRASDRRGNMQPEWVPFNEQGYLYWAVVDHPITVV